MPARHEATIACPMIDFFRQLLRSTPLARAWRYRRSLQRLSSWAPHDDVMRSFYAQFVTAGCLCFDVGANMGNRTKIFRRLGARVLAVEPQANCLEVLRRAFAEDPGVTVLAEAAGAAPGTATLFASDVHTLSSLSKEWIETVRGSGRFANHRWDSRQTVPVTTLDKLIAAHGRPDFIKIDVEGFELDVLRGLTQPVRALSFEFTPEMADVALDCVDYLDRLGEAEFNYSLGESMTLVNADWWRSEDIKSRLKALRSNNDIFGDVYARFAPVPSRCR
jgi:FkbM family methyltransferase